MRQGQRGQGGEARLGHTGSELSVGILGVVSSVQLAVWIWNSGIYIKKKKSSQGYQLREGEIPHRWGGREKRREAPQTGNFQP